MGLGGCGVGWGGHTFRLEEVVLLRTVVPQYQDGGEIREPFGQQLFVGLLAPRGDPALQDVAGARLLKAGGSSLLLETVFRRVC